jgi:pimeloyl-ACP methyl ester carboxylesterase
LLHGSGPLDRDANMEGQTLDTFKVFAEALQRSGIASLRYDKRGCGKSEGTFETAGFFDLVEDASAALDALAARPETRRIVLIGHSEGTLTAPVLAARRADVAGLVLLCPTVAPLETTLMAQAGHLAEDVRTLPGLSGLVARTSFALMGGPIRAQRRLIERVKRSTKETLRGGASPIPAKWLRELLAHDPQPWIARVPAPMLCISGEKDTQCSPDDGHRIAVLAKAPVEVHVLPDLTHILRRDDRPPCFARYRAILGEPIDPRVLDLACDWIARLT